MDSIAPDQNVKELAGELAEHCQENSFLSQVSMGGLVKLSLKVLDQMR